MTAQLRGLLATLAWFGPSPSHLLDYPETVKRIAERAGYVTRWVARKPGAIAHYEISDAGHVALQEQRK